MAAYEPQIASIEEVNAEFDAMTEKYEAAAADVFTDEAFAAQLTGLRDPALREAFAKRLPLIHRFVVAELDTEAPSKRGMGRLSDGDPPPRLGAKYRKQLRDESTRRE